MINTWSKFFLQTLKYAVISYSLIFVDVYAYDTENPTKYDIEREQKKMEGVGIDITKKGESINLNLPFKNEAGEDRAIGSYFTLGKPVLLSMVYYMCPSLCNLHMNGVAEALSGLDLKAGDDFSWVTVSMEPKETYDLAAKKKESYIESFDKKDEARKGWHFLVGDEPNVKELTKQLGFTYRWDEETNQYAHTSAVYVLTPDGKISQIISGTTFDPKTLKLAIIEASKGLVGSFIDRAIMMCFQFNPEKNRYTIYAYNIMKLGGLLTLILLGVFLVPSWLKAIRS